MSKITRRQALKGLLVGGSVAAFGGMQTFSILDEAQADSAPEQEVPDRHYIFCYFSGGWDILLSLDPRDPVTFNAGNAATTRIWPAYELLSLGDTHPLQRPREDLVFGPYMGELMAPDLLDRLLVIRGMSMDTLTHEVGRRRFLTGKPPAGLAARGSSMDTWLASRITRDEPLPNLSVRVESYNKGLPNFASAVRTSSSADLLRLLAPGDVQLSAMDDRHVDELLRAQGLCSSTHLSPTLRDAEEARLKTRHMLASQLDALFDFQANTPQMEALRDHFGIRRGQTSGPQVEAAIAATAVINGVSRCVSIQATGGLDTHFDNWITDHGPNQRTGFDAVAALARYLQKTPYRGDPNAATSWLDHTTIIGFSEFSRTPMLNSNSGRDHWLNNACFLLGGSIAGGKVIGKSTDFGMYPSKVNLRTGALDPSGEIVRPEHIIQALFEEVGITSEPDLRVSALRAMMKG